MTTHRQFFADVPHTDSVQEKFTSSQASTYLSGAGQGCDRRAGAGHLPLVLGHRPWPLNRGLGGQTLGPRGQGGWGRAPEGHAGGETLARGLGGPWLASDAGGAHCSARGL